MAKQTNSQDLNNLILNRVTSPTAFQEMVDAGLINSDELYLVEGEEGITYTFADGTAGNFTVTPSNGEAQTVSVGKPATAGAADTAVKFATNQSITLTGDTTGSASSQAGWSIATTTSLLSGNKIPADAISKHPGDGKLAYHYRVDKGTAGLFSATNNANAIFSFNKHEGNYDSQLGFNGSDGRVYYRNFNGSALNTTTEWKSIAFVSDITKTAVGLSNVTNHQQVHEVAWDKTNKKITRSKNGAAGDVVQFVQGGGIALTAADGKLTIAHSNASITAKTAAAQSAKTLTWGGTFTLYEEKYDAYGHITGVASYNMTMPANPNTDEKVKQNLTSENASYKLLTTTTASPTSGTAYEANYSANLAYNPSENKLSTGNLDLTGELDVVGNANLHNQTTIDSATVGSLLVNGSANFNQIPTAPTAAAGTSNTQLATTEFVTNATSGLSSAMHFIGKATVAITDGSTTNPSISGYDFTSDRKPGDVIIDKDNAYEYVWTIAGAWERLGPDGSYKVLQPPVTTDPTVDGSTTAFVSSVTQDANGNITVAKKDLDTSGTWSGTAVKATQDGSGNNIADTYVKKSGDTMTGNLTLEKVNLRVRSPGTASIEYSYLGSDVSNSLGIAYHTEAYSGSQRTTQDIKSAGWSMFRVPMTKNGTLKGGCFFWGQQSLNSSTGKGSGYYEYYKLPETEHDLTATTTYDILTSKTPLYWANTEVAQEVAYDKEPEIKSVIIGNGSGTTAATKKVQLIYDSSLEVLNFVFT